MRTPTFIDLPPLTVRAAVSSVDEKKRTVELIFSTGAAVDRVDYMTGRKYREVLGTQAANVRLDRLNAGAPLLNSHSAYSISDVIGTVEPQSARMENSKGLATVRFSKRDDVEPVFQDVVDGIIGSVSVGYRVHRFEETTPRNGETPTRTAVDWEPFELSLVSMPADPGARVRDGAGAANQCEIVYRVGVFDEPSLWDQCALLRFQCAKSGIWVPPAVVTLFKQQR